ncbi:hypothetical protein JCM19314_1259 [Nonlabens ulvanivorans]|uniref:Uncharacterized protein n=1 Tax=Nonlabens ulvanivorans TaxID=906888 RepID=A0A090QF01_NONUL|nr:hypothetical protein [Nonlabens ulvanivorans]GAL01476.1 hypothetical protein JCM19314_1259 [Nonlabens ulvanivorans]
MLELFSRFIFMKFFTFSFIFLFSLNLFGQNDKVETSLIVIPDTEESSQSNASGDSMIQYNNYRLFDLLSIIYKIPIEYFQLKNVKENPLLKFEVRTSAKSLDPETVVKELSNAINQVLHIDISVLESNKPTLTMVLNNNNKMKFCDYNLEPFGTQKTSTIINRTFKGNCVNSQDIIEVINNWFNTNIINEINQSYVFDISMHKSNSFNDFNKEMRSEYNIEFIEKTQRVKTLLISQF